MIPVEVIAGLSNQQLRTELLYSLEVVSLEDVDSLTGLRDLLTEMIKRKTT